MSVEKVELSDVFVPTDAGSDELKGGSTRLLAAALQLLVLFDGKKDLAQVAQAAAGLTPDEVRETAQDLALKGYIEIAAPEQEINIDFASFFGGPPSAGDSAPTEQAKEEADKVTRSLNLNGYYVSIARRSASKRAPVSGSTYSVLVIEDHPDIQRSLKFLLTFEKFAVRVAGNRAEIVAELRVVPSPDVILLDVNLPDANGFDILARVRQHPALKSIPVIMLTAQATREDVLRGIAGGADGYITKPFENEYVINGVRSVLGL